MTRLACSPLLVLVSLPLALAAGGCAALDDVDEPDAPGAGGKADDPGSAPGAWLSPAEWEQIRTRCTPAVDEPALSFADYRWGYTLDDMAARYAELYRSPSRLRDRAFYDETRGELVMRVNAAWGSTVVLPPRLVVSVRRHIEKALERGYADFIFFPDMGHSHFFIPEARWDERYRGRPVSGIADMLSDLLDDPALEVLYHTAEQLALTDEAGAVLADRRVQWRFFTRNPIGDNRGLGTIDLHHAADHKMNTLHAYAGHHYYGGGFYLSANERGCFAFTHDGETRYFDLNFAGL